MKISRKQFQSIARIYDVLLDDTNWTEVLDELANQTGCVGISLFISDHIFKDLSSIRLSSALLPHVESYLKNSFDEPEISFTLDFAKLIKQQELIEISELVKRCNEKLEVNHDLSAVEKWSRESFGVYHRYASPLGFEPAYFDVATFQFGKLSRATLKRNLELATLYLPHLKKANELSRPFNLLRSRFNAVLSVLDRFHLGVFILAPDGSIVVQNSAAERILDLHDGLETNQANRLYASDSVEQPLMEALVARAGSLANGEANEETERVTIGRKSGKTPFFVEISAIRNKDIAINGIFTGVLVIAIDPDHHSIVEISGLETLYGLTPAEKQVCMLLVSGLTTGEIAESRDSSPETVRNQVKALLDKTKSRHRAELVRLALSINLPVDLSTE